MYAKVCNSLLSKHVVDVLEDIVVNKASSLRSILEDKSNGIAKDKDLVSKYVKEFIYEIMEHMYSLLSKDDRQLLFNDIAKQFNVKVNDENQINKPLHIELVKDNFNSIMSALKFYEQKQNRIDAQVQKLQEQNQDLMMEQTKILQQIEKQNEQRQYQINQNNDGQENNVKAYDSGQISAFNLKKSSKAQSQKGSIMKLSEHINLSKEDLDIPNISATLGIQIQRMQSIENEKKEKIQNDERKLKNQKLEIQQKERAKKIEILQKERAQKIETFYQVKTLNTLKIQTELTNQFGVPDSFALILDKYVLVQFKQKKLIQVFQLGDYVNKNTENSNIYFTIDNALSRNGKSFCIYNQYLAIRNLKAKQFEIINIEEKKIVLKFAYEDIWYYNNYHVLGSIFVFPHYMKVQFFDSSNNFIQLKSEGVDYDWYKNDDSSKAGSTLEKNGKNDVLSMQFRKKFVIMKDSNIICFDSGEGRIQVYTWRLEDSVVLSKPKTIVFEKFCSLRDHQISEVIDSNIVSIVDFKFNKNTKLLDVIENKMYELPSKFEILSNQGQRFIQRTFSSQDNAFSLESASHQLNFHYNEFQDKIEIVNHDCLDYVFYQNKQSKEIKVLSFIEQNEQYMLKLDLIEYVVVVPEPIDVPEVIIEESSQTSMSYKGSIQGSLNNQSQTKSNQNNPQINNPIMDTDKS